MPSAARSQSSRPLSLGYAALIDEPLSAYVTPSARKSPHHFGVHPFPGRKDPNVISAYILHHTEEGDTVIDPFVGSGTTAREALLNRRRVIVADINPVMELITRGSVVPVDLPAVRAAFARIKGKVSNRILAIERMGSEDVAKELSEYDLSFLLQPIHPVIQRGASRGINRLIDIQDPRQILGLLILRTAISSETDPDAKLILDFAFSRSLKYATRMYTTGSKSYWRGNATLFQHYAYQVPREFAYKNVWEIFEYAFESVIDRKEKTQELLGDFVREGETFIFLRGSATQLPELLRQKGISSEGIADYCITDPPYAEVIQYPLLFSLWYAWLGMQPPHLEEDLTIVAKGQEVEYPILKERFLHQLDQSLSAISQVLCDGCWLTLFYQHSDLGYWSPIVEAASRHSLQYINVVPHPAQVRSYAQQKHPFKTLAGTLLANFRKLPQPVSPRGGQVEAANRLVFPSLRKFAELELQRVIVEYLGADTKTIGYHLLSVLLDPSLMSDRLLQAVDIVELIKENELEAFGAEHANHLEDLWMLSPNIEIDPVLDLYDRLRYHLFAFLRRKGTALPQELHAEGVRYLARESASGQQLSADIGSVLSEFAEQVDGCWKYSPETRLRAIQPRLLLAQTTAHKLRPVFFQSQEQALRLRPDNLAVLWDRLIKQREALGSEAFGNFWNVLVAALTQLRDRYPTQIRSVAAIEELASGTVDVGDLGYVDIPLGIVCTGSDNDLAELEYSLAMEVFGPIFLDMGVMFTTLIRPPGEAFWLDSSDRSLVLIESLSSSRAS